MIQLTSQDVFWLAEFFNSPQIQYATRKELGVISGVWYHPDENIIVVCGEKSNRYFNLQEMLLDIKKSVTVH